MSKLSGDPFLLKSKEESEGRRQGGNWKPTRAKSLRRTFRDPEIVGALHPSRPSAEKS